MYLIYVNVCCNAIDVVEIAFQFFNEFVVGFVFTLVVPCNTDPASLFDFSPGLIIGEKGLHYRFLLTYLIWE